LTADGFRGMCAQTLGGSTSGRDEVRSLPHSNASLHNLIYVLCSNEEVT
jgi:hypothetical protein